jgi:hypothetical protein
MQSTTKETKMAAATEKQVAFIRTLLDEKELTLEPGVTVDDLKAAAEGIDKQRASRWIEELLKRPRKLKSENGRVADSVKYAHVPNGRYALEDPSDELNPVKFYRISFSEQSEDYQSRNTHHIDRCGQ